MSVLSVLPPFRLTFLLPDGLAAFVRPGLHSPCLAGVLLHIRRGGLVAIEGGHRRAIFDQARRFFRMVAKDRPAFIVSAALVRPDRVRESWEIAVNSDVTFTRDFAPIISTEIEHIRNGQG
jgi:hypothetical protein